MNQPSHQDPGPVGGGSETRPPPSLASAERRRLKAAAQRLKPAAQLGQAGLTDELVRSVDGALAARELVKVKFAAHQEERHELADALAARTASRLVTVIGHVAVLYRPKPPPPATEGLTARRRP